MKTYYKTKQCICVDIFAIVAKVNEICLNLGGILFWYFREFLVAILNYHFLTRKFYSQKPHKMWTTSSLLFPDGQV